MHLQPSEDMNAPQMLNEWMERWMTGIASLLFFSSDEKHIPISRKKFASE